MRGRLQNIADGGVVIYAPACPDARHPYVITQCKRSVVARLLRHRVLLPLHPHYPSACRQGAYAPGPWHAPGDPFVAAPVTPGIIVAHSSSVLRPAHPWLTANCWRTAPSPAKLCGPRSQIHTYSSVRVPAPCGVCVGGRGALVVSTVHPELPHGSSVVTAGLGHVWTQWCGSLLVSPAVVFGFLLRDSAPGTRRGARPARAVLLSFLLSFCARVRAQAMRSLSSPAVQPGS